VIPYCSSTGTRSTRAALQAAGWRVLVVPTGKDKNYGLDYAIDNGAWSAYQRGLPFDEKAFMRTLKWSAKQDIKPDWIVVPDIVAGGIKSLEYSLGWIDRVSSYGPLLLAVQDGMTPEHIERYIGSELGIFLGGTTQWKLSTMMEWGELCHSKAKDGNRPWYHCGRVNTVRRISLCASSGADSFDGTSVARFPCNLGRLNRARKQLALPLLG